MKRKAFRHRGVAAWAVGMALLTAGCATEEDFVYDVADAAPQLQLTLTMQDAQIVTRSTEAGIDALNENKIETVDVFLYKQGDDPATDDATLVKRVTATDDGYGAYIVECWVKQSQLSSLITDYEGSNTPEKTCTAYVLVNRPSDVPLPNATNTTALNQLALTCNAFGQSTAVDPDTPVRGRTGNIPDNFVMCGLAENGITLTDDDVFGEKRLLRGSVDVSRAAAKISFTISRIKQSVEAYEDGVDPDNPGDAAKMTWHPDRDNIRIELVNGQQQGYVNAPELPTPTEGWYSTAPIGPEAIRMLPKDDEPGYEEYYSGMTDIQAEAIKYVHEVPFYTYPTNWKRDINHRAYLLLTVMWKAEGQSSYQPTYYEIPIDDLDELLLRNTHYHIDMDVAIIGSFKRDKAVNVGGCSYKVLPWGMANYNGSSETTSAELKATRFLVASETEAVMNNEDAYTIPFVSSHYGKDDNGNDQLEIVELKLERMIAKDPSGGIYRTIFHTTGYDSKDNDARYNKSGSVITPVAAMTRPFNVIITSPEKEGEAGYITVEHQLNNSISADGDFTPYRITFTIQHRAPYTEFHETIVLTQYPMIYVETEMNTDCDEDWAWNSDHTERVSTKPTDAKLLDHHGYVWINDNHTISTTNRPSSDDEHGRTVSVAESMSNTFVDNNNPNRYIVSLTSLTTDDYIIGDPRKKAVELPTQEAAFKYYTFVASDKATAETWPKTTKESSPRYFPTGLLYYYSYSQYQNQASLGVTIERYDQSNVSTLPRGYSSAQAVYNARYRTEDNPVPTPDAQGWYYWCTAETSGLIFTTTTYTLHRARYLAPGTGYYNTLTYYHPTDETNNTKNMIAPKFMVASSYGKGKTLYKSETAVRCASYQEDGYPAGRWRVPTYAEVKFLTQLSINGIIPGLFRNNYDYWCAQGYVSINSGESGELKTNYTSTDGKYVRCVYDTWYWGDDKCEDKNSFTWGDR